MRHRGHLLIWELQLVLLFLALKSEGSAEGCPEGFARDESGHCTDDNECTMDANDYEDHTEICGENADCFNTKGSYYCQCKSGFRSTKGNVNFTIATGDSCRDINECIEGNIDCGPHAECQNVQGNYTCVCKDGFRISSGEETFWDGQGLTCQDIDECTVENINCGPHATCKNNDGSYDCVCEDGFETSSGEKTFSDGKGVTCQGTNKCETDSTICGGNATCHSIPGGHYCVCNPGFRLKSGNINFTNEAESCKDICVLHPSICGQGECRQGLKGHQCICHNGYTNYGLSQEACTGEK